MGEMLTEYEWRKNRNTTKDGKLRTRVPNVKHSAICGIDEYDSCLECLNEIWPDSVYLTGWAILGEHP